MANVTRIDPLLESFDHLMRRFAPQADPSTLFSDIRVDVEENDKAFVVRAEMPGVKKEDIDVQIDGNVVILRAESKVERELKEGNRVIRSERGYGSMFRSLVLGADIDESRAEAKYSDGVLTLTLPKKAEGSGSKRVTVQ